MIKRGSSWTYLTNEEVAELNQSTYEQLSDEELRAAMEEAPLQDMFAKADGGQLNISISIDNLGVLYGTTMEDVTADIVALFCKLDT